MIWRHLFYDGEQTVLKSGDILKYSPAHQTLRFYRGDVRLQIGFGGVIIDDKLPLTTNEFVCFMQTTALSNGLYPITFDASSDEVVVQLQKVER